MLIANKDDNWRYFGDPVLDYEDYSPLDSARFGMKVCRIEAKGIEDLRKHKDALVFARIDANDIDLLHKACGLGYFICDTLTYWKGSTSRSVYELGAAGYWIRAIEKRDAEAIGEIARTCFKTYKGHYHADPGLDREKVAEGYIEWATTATEGVVVEHERCEFPHVHRKVVAFGTFGLPCELVLAGVDDAHRGKGLYADLVAACMDWGFRKGAPEIVISTQVTNIAVQKVWSKFGLSPYKHVYTLHRWPK